MKGNTVVWLLPIGLVFFDTICVGSRVPRRNGSSSWGYPSARHAVAPYGHPGVVVSLVILSRPLQSLVYGIVVPMVVYIRSGWHAIVAMRAGLGFGAAESPGVLSLTHGASVGCLQAVRPCAEVLYGLLWLGELE